MTPINIIKCVKCQNFMLAAKTQKTKTCPYCNAKNNLWKTKIIASAQTSAEASKILKQLKEQRGFPKS
ncbi:MAG: DUF1922 domain-containing protein [Candidatus Bathyarchaeota archaeon]|nr:DUF1922 domain-containing protein [Candidatus Bathyarchaeota archaeon]